MKKTQQQASDKDDLQQLLAKIQSPTCLAEMPRRVELCRQALAIIDRAMQPELWAALQNELANSLAQSPQGDRAENLEQAIAHYQQALQVYTRQAFPVDWAMTQNNLGTAYADRIRGDRAENIERAIHHYEQALEVRTRQAFPVDWAMTQNNLGTAYADRIRGDRAENIERAIHHYQQALQVYTRQADPERWAATQNNLANAYLNRIRGDRAENIERAIHHYQQALAIYTFEATPFEYARTLYNLGLLYHEQADLEQALDALNRSLDSFAAIGLTQEANTVRAARANVAYELGRQYVQQGRWYDGLRLLEDCLAVRRQGDDLDALADVIYQIGFTHHLMGDAEEARIRYRDALRLYERTGNRRGIAACKARLGHLAVQTGMLDRAARELEQAKQIYTELGDTQRIGDVEDVLRLADRIRERQPV